MCPIHVLSPYVLSVGRIGMSFQWVESVCPLSGSNRIDLQLPSSPSGVFGQTFLFTSSLSPPLDFPFYTSPKVCPHCRIRFWTPIRGTGSACWWPSDVNSLIYAFHPLLSSPVRDQNGPKNLVGFPKPKTSRPFFRSCFSKFISQMHNL